jgi:hypothetical protein
VRVVYRWWAVLLFVLVVVQVGFAGYGAFYAANKLDEEGSTIDDSTFNDGFGLHLGLGYLIILAGLIFLVIGLIAGIGRWRLGWHGSLAGLFILQMLLAWFGYGVPAVFGFLHPVNALVIVAVSGMLAWNEWRGGRAPGAAAVT